MEFQAVAIQTPEGANFILGQSHFIKTVEDLYEILVCSVPGAKFGIAFCESSGPCLIRSAGNDEPLREAAIRNAQANNVASAAPCRPIRGMSQTFSTILSAQE